MGKTRRVSFSRKRRRGGRRRGGRRRKTKRRGGRRRSRVKRRGGDPSKCTGKPKGTWVKTSSTTCHRCGSGETEDKNDTTNWRGCV